MTRNITPRLTAMAAATLMVTGANAFEIDAGDSGLKIRWDTTARYSGGVRLKEQLPELSSVAPVTINQNDGNNNFKKGGMFSNRLDLLTEFDVVGPRYGLRVSAAAWYDAVYNRDTDNTTTTSNHRPANEFPSETRRIMGRDAEVLDALWGGEETLIVISSDLSHYLPYATAQRVDGETVQWMERVSHENGIILTGSIIIEEDGKYFNRLIWMLPNGEMGH